jgi:LCP family protein required for cell wall assembly
LRKRLYSLYKVEGTHRRRWTRVAIWSAVALVLIILAVAGGSYLWFRTEVSSANNRVTPEIRAALQQKPSTTLTTTPPKGLTDPVGSTRATAPVTEPSPSAMNLLVIGSDRRSDDPSLGGRSDTLMIVHIDPDQNYLSVLSLPRDLRVSIPGHGKNKLNSAFAFGGPALAIETIEQTTGVDINHYLEVGFDAFKDIVDSLGGIYVDVDKRYYNPDYYYEPINLYPGYQLLNGADALDYVRFRHDRNMDFGRMERQQRFMTAVREQAMGWDLPLKLPGLISALFKNVTTDLSANQILRLTTWGIRLNGDGIRSITLTGATPTIGGASYVVVSENDLAKAVNELLNQSEPDPPGASTTTSEKAKTTTTKQPDLAGITVDVLGASGRAGQAAAAANWLSSLGAAGGSSREDRGNGAERSSIQYPAGMSSEAKRVATALGVDSLKRASVDHITLVLGQDFILPPEYAPPASPDSIPDAPLWKQWAAQTPYAVEAPAYIPDGYAYTRRMPDNRASYGIKVGSGEKPAFRMLYALETNEDQVMGITETTWLDAPAASKGLSVTHDGVVFTVVRNDQKVERVWWKANGVLYFVSNTLSHSLDQDEMLKIAESMIAIPVR